MAYTYLIGWSKFNTWYYGIRFAKNCQPEDLWTTYFTSSKYVKQFRKQNGEPDIIQIRKIFDSKEKAILWEHKVLKRLNVISNEKWLNKTDNKTICPEAARNALVGRSPWNKGKSIPRTKESIEKQRKTITGRKRNKYDVNLSEERLNQLRLQMLGNKINLGKKLSDEEKLKRSKSNIGIYWWTNEEIEVKSRECPPGFTRGRLKQRQRNQLLDQEL